MKTRKQRRSGNVLVMAAAVMVVMIAMIAFALDIGYIQVVRSELQRTADATALAAAWDLIDEDKLAGTGDPYAKMEVAKLTADQFARLNLVAGAEPTLGYQDLDIGYIQDPSVADPQMDYSDPTRYNAVRVLVRRTPEQNGEVLLFFARAMGIDGYAGQMEATAVFLDNIAGFRHIPGEMMGILPFAFDQSMWDNLIGGAGNDDFTSSRVWNETTGEWDWDVTAGSDGVREINLFPQNNSSPGNFGTIDIGAPNNSTNTLRRQITDGLTADDMSYYPDNALQLDSLTGTLSLNGDTGISAGMESALRAIVGKPRIVPLFSQLSGNGSNAVYTIVKFVGVRVVEVDLSGGLNSNKRLILQPANVTIPGAIRATGGDPINPAPADQKSQFVYSPVYLID